MSNLRQLWFCNCQNCANYEFTIVTLAHFIFLKLSFLHQLWFYNCQTCANYDFTIVRLAPTMIVQLSDLRNYDLTIVTLAPIIFLQLSFLCQQWFYICQNCANYNFTIVTLGVKYDFQKRLFERLYYLNK